MNIIRISNFITLLYSEVRQDLSLGEGGGEGHSSKNSFPKENFATEEQFNKIHSKHPFLIII